MAEVTAKNYEASALDIANQAVTAEVGSSSTRIRLKSRSGNVLSEDSILGPKGAKGATGAKGETGPVGDTGAIGAAGNVGATAPARAVSIHTISMTFVADVVTSVAVTFPAGKFSATPNVHATAVTNNISTKGSSKASGIYGLSASGGTKDGTTIFGVSRSSGTFTVRVIAMAKD